MKLGRGWNAGAIEFFDTSILRTPSNPPDALIVPAQDRGQILNSRDTVNIARWQSTCRAWRIATGTHREPALTWINH
jgi:hypothetical protein